MKHLITAAVFVLGATPASHASVILNGMFDDGLEGWTAQADTNFSDPVQPGSYVNVQQNGGNPYARLISDPDADSTVTFVSLTHAFQVPASAPILSFDFGLALDEENSINPPRPAERSASLDNFQAIITDLGAAGTIFDPGRYILVDRTTASPPGNPSQTTVTDNANWGEGGSSGVSLDLTTQDATDPFFDTTVAVDLTNLIARDLSIQFLIRDYFDGRQTAYAVDNILFSQASGVTPEPAAIPLPTSIWLLAGGIGGLGIFRRR